MILTQGDGVGGSLSEYFLHRLIMTPQPRPGGSFKKETGFE